MFERSGRGIIVAGHRGYKARYPENTMISFQKAIELGVDMIEMDLNLTSDKQLVVIHDQTVDRTTNGSGRVSDFTLDAIGRLDAGSWFSETFAGLRIPTFTEFLELASKTEELLLNVEIKEKIHETVDLAIRELEKFHMLDRSVIACFDAAILKYAKQAYNMKTQGFPLWYMQDTETDSYSYMYAAGIEMRDLKRPLCDELRQRGVRPWGYCPDTDESIAQVIESSAEAVTCNNPEPALRILKEKGLRH